MPVYDEELTIRTYGHLLTIRPQELKCVLDLAAAKGSPILELACGAGRILMELSRRNYEVYGLDISMPMLKLAKQEIEKLGAEAIGKIHLVRGNMTQFAFARKFPLIIVPYHSFWYNLRPDGAEKCLGLISDHLEEGSKFFIDRPLPGASCEIYCREAGSPKWWYEMARKYNFRCRFIHYNHPLDPEMMNGICHDIYPGNHCNGIEKHESRFFYHELDPDLEIYKLSYYAGAVIGERA